MSKEEGGAVFTPGERLILALLCDLFKSQKIKSDLDIDFIQTALGGDEWAISQKYSTLIRPDVPSKELVDETYKILSMWDHLEREFSALPGEAKQRVLQGSQWHEQTVYFPGFDGNNEDHHGVAFFIMHHMKSFESLKKYALNAHMPTIEMHRRMLGAYMAAVTGGGRLGEPELIEIMREHVHPENRGR